jgi:hypothetical protein
MILKEIFAQVPDPRGGQGQDYRLWSLLSLIAVGFLCGRQGLMSVFRLGRSLNHRQRHALGFVKGTTPCHATLTETMRIIDPDALSKALCNLAICNEGEDARHVALDGKTMRASKDQDGKAVHCLSAFCCGLREVVGQTASRGKGMEIPDALKLLAKLDLKNKVITGDAMFCQKKIYKTIVDGGGDYVFPVKGNQKHLQEDIKTAFNEPIFPPAHLGERARKGARAH